MDNENINKDLGCANSWREDPVEFTAHRELGHAEDEQYIGRCLYRYSCDECGIKWTVDSSD